MKVAYAAGRAGGTMTGVLSAANEQARTTGYSCQLTAALRMIAYPVDGDGVPGNSQPGSASGALTRHDWLASDLPGHNPHAVASSLTLGRGSVAVFAVEACARCSEGVRARSRMCVVGIIPYLPEAEVLAWVLAWLGAGSGDVSPGADRIPGHHASGGGVLRSTQAREQLWNASLLGT